MSDALIPKEGIKMYVEIKSRQTDIGGAGLFGKEGTQLSKMLEDISAVQDPEVSGRRSGREDCVLSCEGIFSQGEDGMLCLSYDEQLLGTGEYCNTAVCFYPDSPKRVTVVRSGAVSSSFVIEEKRRQISVYSTPYGPLEMCVWAKKVKNAMGADGGTIEMDYAVELKGMSAQRTGITVTARPASDT